jgi:hypothetical protein
MYSSIGLADPLDENPSCPELLAKNISAELIQQMQQAVLKYGSSAGSFDVFESPSSYKWFPFEGKHGPGGIAFKEAYLTRVIIGDPLLAKEDWADALNAFFAARMPFTVTMATFASKEFADLALATHGAAIEVQTEMTLNPQVWEPSGSKTARHRKYHRAYLRNFEFVTMKNQKEPEPWFREAAENLIAEWKTTLKREGSTQDVNLWDASVHKQYFAFMDPATKKFQAMVLARPLAAIPGFSLWTARAPGPNGALEATILETIRSMREDGATYLTFGPYQEARALVYVDKSGGTFLSRLVLEKFAPIYIKRDGVDRTTTFIKKFDFGDSQKNYNLIWPRKAWIRPHAALRKIYPVKQIKRGSPS